MHNFVTLKLFSYVRREVDSYFELQIISVFFITFLLEAGFPLQNFSELNISIRILTNMIKKPFLNNYKVLFHLKDIDTPPHI